MRLHTYTISRSDVLDAAARFGLTVPVLTEHGSRTHDHAFEIQLSGSSTRQAQSNQWNAATWDEWGAFMGDLYTRDPDARWGTSSWGYADSADFDRKTCGRFRDGMPHDTHPQHKWQYDHATSSPLSDIARHYCTKCSARTER